MGFKPPHHRNQKFGVDKLTETLYVTGVVIANGIADSDGDLLTKKDIKTIFTKYLKRDTDTMHTNISNDGVDVLANWISESETIVDGQNVPSGSWLATFKITNPKLINCIQTGKLTGLSLGSVSEEAMTPKYWFVNKSMNYRDLNSIEEVIPLFISFVDRPANQFRFEVMEYDAYINKSNKKTDGVMMTENNEEMVSVSTIAKIKELFISKAEEEPVTEETVDEPSADDKVTALFEKLDLIIEQNSQILESIQKAEEEDEEVEESVDEEEEIEKAEEETDEAVTEESTEEVEIEKSEEIEEPVETEEEDDVVETEEVEIEKRETNMVENQITESVSDFYGKTGRDAFGRKIKR